MEVQTTPKPPARALKIDMVSTLVAEAQRKVIAEKPAQVNNKIVFLSKLLMTEENAKPQNAAEIEYDPTIKLKPLGSVSKDSMRLDPKGIMIMKSNTCRKLIPASNISIRVSRFNY